MPPPPPPSFYLRKLVIFNVQAPVFPSGYAIVCRILLEINLRDCLYSLMVMVFIQSQSIVLPALCLHLVNSFTFFDFQAKGKEDIYSIFYKGQNGTAQAGTAGSCGLVD